MPPRSRWGAPPLRGGPNTTPVDADLVIFTPAPGAPARRARSGSDSLCLERVGWTLSPRPCAVRGGAVGEMGPRNRAGRSAGVAPPGRPRADRLLRGGHRTPVDERRA